MVALIFPESQYSASIMQKEIKFKTICICHQKEQIKHSLLKYSSNNFLLVLANGTYSFLGCLRKRTIISKFTS